MERAQEPLFSRFELSHDYIGHHVVRQEGPRILTFYLYLNEVEAGGGTEFGKLGLVVTPKTGRAVLWPSVLNADPSVNLILY
jgi:prolyl 4-hydroxylase